MPDITELFKRISTSLASDFDLVRLIPHHGESGRATEEVLKRVLTNHLAGRFHVTSGFVIGEDGAVSHQADLLVIDAINCPRLLGIGGVGLYPLDGVVATVEVTQNLDSEKRQTDLEKVREFRGLSSTFSDSFAPDFRDRAPLAFLFADRSATEIRTVGRWLLRVLRDTGAERRGTLPNGVVSLDKGLVVYVAENGNVHADPCNATGVAIIKKPDIALLMFLLFLMGKARVLIEHRIRARTATILGIRSGGHPPAREVSIPILNAAGGECYFGDLLEYFSIDDREVFDKLVDEVEVIRLSDQAD